MSADQLITISVLSLVICALASNRFSADVVLFAAMLTLMFSGVLDAKQAFEGFSNEAIYVIAMMFIITAALRETGVLNLLGESLFAGVSTYRKALLRLTLPASFFSAFVNNTPVVSMLIPVVQDWSVRSQVSASKLLLPLSYATILGGMLTLFGSSTNLILSGLMVESFGEGLTMFSMTPVGIIIYIAGITTALTISPALLKQKQKKSGAVFKDIREFCFRMIIDSNGSLNNKTIEEAGLRHLVHCYLFEIIRDHSILTAVSSSTVIKNGDLLIFTGRSEAAAELRNIRGLVPDEGQVEKLESKASEREIIEAVISFNYPYLYKKVRDIEFRKKIGAVVLAVSRGGKRLNEKPGNIELKPGDILLLEAPPGFTEKNRNNRDFLLISHLNSIKNNKYNKGPLAISILFIMFFLVTFQLQTVFIAASLAASALIISGCLTTHDAKKSINYSLLATIAFSFALGKSIEVSGLDAIIAHLILEVSLNKTLALAVIFAVTVLLTENITNSATVVLLFPICIAVSAKLDVNSMPFIMTVLFAASSSFLTPLGYQTNLMVYGPGRYTYSDYFKAGLPVTLVSALVTIIFVPIFWPFK